MYRPKIDGLRICPAGYMATDLFHCAADLGWHLARKLHVETQLSNLPSDQTACVWNAKGKEAVDGKACLVCTYEAGRATISEEQERKHLLQVLRLLQVQRAQLEIEHQYFC